MPSFLCRVETFVFDAEPRISFSGEKTRPSLAEILSKRARAELRLLQNITKPK